MFEIINFNKFSDGRGDLIPIELGIKFERSYIPFDVKRIYFISSLKNANNSIRGNHAHIDDKSVIICAQGSFVLDLEDSNGQKNSILLNKNDMGIYIKKSLVWRELKNFSPDCVVIVLVSNHFDESDYIRNYSVFKKLCNE